MVPTSMFNTYKVFCNLIWHIVMVMCSPQFCTCWPSFWKVVPRHIVASRRANYSAVRWMEEAITHSKRLPPPFLSNTYKCFTTFLCCGGCAYIWVLITFLQLLLAKIFEDMHCRCLEAYSCRNPQNSCVFRSCGVFFHMNHSSCSAVTFLQPP